MANKRPITKTQRQKIGGMWADYAHAEGEDVIACEMRFRIDVPASDHNPAELACKLFAKAFEEQFNKMCTLQQEFFNNKLLPTMPGASTAAEVVGEVAAIPDEVEREKIESKHFVN